MKLMHSKQLWELEKKALQAKLREQKLLTSVKKLENKALQSELKLHIDQQKAMFARINEFEEQQRQQQQAEQGTSADLSDDQLEFDDGTDQPRGAADQQHHLKFLYEKMAKMELENKLLQAELREQKLLAEHNALQGKVAKMEQEQQQHNNGKTTANGHTGTNQQLDNLFINGRPFPDQIRQRIVDLAKDGMSSGDISRNLLVSRGCVSKVLAHFWEHGTVHCSEHRLPTREMCEKIKLYKDAQPSIFAWEIRDRLIQDKVCTDETLPSIYSINCVLRSIQTRKDPPTEGMAAGSVAGATMDTNGSVSTAMAMQNGQFMKVGDGLTKNGPVI